MPKKKPSQKKSEPTIQGVLGIGLDGDDGQKRITRTEEMVLVGGSEQTHEQMQETAIRFSESLEQRGKRLADVSLAEAVDLLQAAHDRTGR